MGASLKGIYLDYAASTPLDPEVFEAMRSYFLRAFGNPGSLHSFGQEAIAAVDRSREEIAGMVGAEFRELIFTGSATEANNLALRGAIGKAKASYSIKPHLIISSIEHESVLETARDLEHEGAEVTYLPVDERGFVRSDAVRAALKNSTVLVSIMYANNEIGSVQPIPEIAAFVRNFRETRTNGPLPSAYPLIHTDAVQAFQFLNCRAGDLGVDMMTLSAHKLYGPKGIGALYVKSLAPSQILSPIVTGGGQEFALRSGTENVPSIVGFAKAVALILERRTMNASRLTILKKRFIEGLKGIRPDMKVIGGDDTVNSYLPNIVNFHIPGFSGSDLVIKFDLEGLAVSSGSACRARSSEPSSVLKAMGCTKEECDGSIRVSFGWPTTEEEIDKALKIITMSVEKHS